MPSWLKLVLALLGAGALGFVLFVGGIVWWLNKNKDRLIEGAQAAQAEGKDFGSTHSRAECIDDCVMRLKGCGPVGLECESGIRLRLGSCMSVAKDDGACKEVLAHTGLLKASLWANQECARRGQRGSQACARFMQGVQMECAQSQQ